MEKENKCTPEGPQSLGPRPAVGSKRSAAPAFRPVLQAQHEDRQLQARLDSFAASKSCWEAHASDGPPWTSFMKPSPIRPKQTQYALKSQALDSQWKPSVQSRDHYALQKNSGPLRDDSQAKLAGTKVKKRKVLLGFLKIMPSQEAPSQHAVLESRHSAEPDKHAWLPSLNSDVAAGAYDGTAAQQSAALTSSPAQQQNKREPSRQSALSGIFDGFF